MATIVIKKRVDLDFLGDEYKEGYLVFRSISLADYDKLSADLENLDDKKSVKFLLDTLKTQFITGKFPDEAGKLQEVTVEDLKDFDIETVINVFNRFTGQELPPKV